MPAPTAFRNDPEGMSLHLPMAGKRKRETLEEDVRHNKIHNNGADKQVHELHSWMKDTLEILRRYPIAPLYIL